MMKNKNIIIILVLKNLILTNLYDRIYSNNFFSILFLETFRNKHIILPLTLALYINIFMISYINFKTKTKNFHQKR
jgi:hypothetical protein